MKVCIASSRPIGAECRKWAESYTGYEFVDSIEECEVLFSVLYRDLIKPEQLRNITRAVNFHVGSLPDYRGSACHNWAIINGEKDLGITLHEIDIGIDTGDIIDELKIPIHPEDTAETLLHRSEQMIYKMFQMWFYAVMRGDYDAVAQDRRAGKTYYRKDLQAAKDLTRFVRAFTFEDKEPAFYINAKGEKVYLRL